MRTLRGLMDSWARAVRTQLRLAEKLRKMPETTEMRKLGARTTRLLGMRLRIEYRVGDLLLERAYPMLALGTADTMRPTADDVPIPYVPTRRVLPVGFAPDRLEVGMVLKWDDVGPPARIVRVTQIEAIDHGGYRWTRHRGPAGTESLTLAEPFEVPE